MNKFKWFRSDENRLQTARKNLPKNIHNQQNNKKVNPETAEKASINSIIIKLAQISIFNSGICFGKWIKTLQFALCCPYKWKKTLFENVES